jgi:hypothetical protein
VIGDRVRFWPVLAEKEHRPVTVELPPVPLAVRLAAGDLAPAVDALLGNVFTHTPEGTALTVRVRPRGGRSGAGSTGLGLDIARRTAEGSGGALVLVSSPAGTEVTRDSRSLS